MANREQVITIETTPLIPNLQVFTIETSQKPTKTRLDIVTFETSENIVLPSGTLNVIGNVEISEQAFSETSEPKLLTIVGDVNISETSESISSGTVDILGDVRESYSLNVLNIVNIGEPFQTCYQIFIDNIDYSETIVNGIEISKVDNEVVSFDVEIMSKRQIMDFINKEISIAIVASDEDGNIQDIQTIVIGKITNVERDIKSGIFTLSCFDYGGIHNTLGEYISKEITPILSDEILVDNTGTFDTLHKPILSVRVKTVDPDNPVKDGQDYFVNPLAGTIIVPETSRLVGNGQVFAFDYPDNFDSLSDLLISIANEKGWVIDQSEVNIAEYTAKEKHPIITLSDESIIDILKKLSELSGVKLDTSLFPKLRMYSDLLNFVKPEINSFSYENDIIDGTLSINIGIDNYINKQIVASGNKVFPNAKFDNAEILGSKSDAKFPLPINTVYYGSTGRPSKMLAKEQADQIVLNTPDLIIDRIEVEESQIINSFVEVTGSWFNNDITAPLSFAIDTSSFHDILPSDWVKSLVDGLIRFDLTAKAVLVDSNPSGGPSSTGFFHIEHEGAFNYSVTVKGQKVNYNSGDLADNVEVTATRPAIGIGELQGDTYENAYIETAEQAGNIANSILLTRGNIYGTTFQIPLHKASSLRVGDKITVYNDNIKEHIGLIKELNYTIDFNNAESIVEVVTKGIK